RDHFSLYCSPAHRDLHSFPTRRSSDLLEDIVHAAYVCQVAVGVSRGHVASVIVAIAHGARVARGVIQIPLHEPERTLREVDADLDRKSTRLNSSHLGISYAVFCLKKKT